MLKLQYFIVFQSCLNIGKGGEKFANLQKSIRSNL